MLIIGAKLERVRPMGRGREGVEHGRITLAIDCPRKFPFIAHSVKSRMNIRNLIRGKHPTLIKRLVEPIFSNSTREKKKLADHSDFSPPATLNASSFLSIPFPLACSREFAEARRLVLFRGTEPPRP